MCWILRREEKWLSEHLGRLLRCLGELKMNLRGGRQETERPLEAFRMIWKGDKGMIYGSGERNREKETTGKHLADKKSRVSD